MLWIFFEDSERSSHISLQENEIQSTSKTTTPTQSCIVPQLPSPPETLYLPSEFLVKSASSLAIDESPGSRPSTPQRGRLESRYPASLGPGRVPLHRRGTSKTYERLEDLLREAGYKETRVFTPETERAEVEAEERKPSELRGAQSGSVRGGVGAVVGYLAGLMSRAPSLARDAHADRRTDTPSGSQTTHPPQQEHSPPLSPLPHKQTLVTNGSSISSRSHSYSPSPTTPTFTSSAESLTRFPRGSFSNNSPDYYITSHNSNSDLTPRAPRLRPQPSFSSNQRQTYAQASKARAYLRHMASAPSIQPSPNSSRPPSVRHSSAKYIVRGGYGYGRRRAIMSNDSDAEDGYTGQRGNGEGEEENEIYGRPPLPRTWLENVARAVLFGGAGAHPGAPSRPLSSHSNPQSPKQRLGNLQMSPSLSIKSELPDQTNVPKALALKGRAPPLLFAQVAARTPSETRVSRARVVCRSAPASRSGSRVRIDIDLGLDMDTKRRNDRGKEKGARVLRKGKEKAKVGEAGNGQQTNGVPCLARTKVQNDRWANLSGGEMYTSSEDEDEGELDLARLLVPPKRQSIQSLRRHLHHGPLSSQFLQGVTSSSARSGTRSVGGSVRGHGYGRSGLSASDQERRHDEDGDEDWRKALRETSSLRARRGKFEGFLPRDERSSGKRRMAIPGGAWAAGS